MRRTATDIFQVVTNPADELITSGLPAILPQLHETPGSVRFEEVGLIEGKESGFSLICQSTSGRSPCSTSSE